MVLAWLVLDGSGFVSWEHLCFVKMYTALAWVAVYGCGVVRWVRLWHCLDNSPSLTRLKHARVWPGRLTWAHPLVMRIHGVLMDTVSVTL